VTEIAYERIGAGKTKNGFSEDVTEFPTLSSLTELYCGNGNHTCSLAPYFDEVSAVEIDPRLCAAAAENFKANGVANATVRALPAEAFAAETEGEDAKKLNGALNTEGVVLVDPPRVGLDEKTLALARKFRSIIYIACDFNALHRDLEERGLRRTHVVKELALFDHFPFSAFVEVAVRLERRGDS
jgi:tRNA (uracil-5-)-methyltransferase